MQPLVLPLCIDARRHGCLLQQGSAIMKYIKCGALAFALAVALSFSAPVNAVPQWCADMGGPPCKDSSGGGEPTGTNNLSYPVIWSDNVATPGFVKSDALWSFGGIIEPGNECVLQASPVTTVPDEVACYYGEKNLGIDEETGQRTFEPPTRTWWLQQRQGLGNQWQVFNIMDEDVNTNDVPFVVTGIDAGDLMESSLTIKAKQIRIEFTLFKRIMGDAELLSVTDADYVDYLAYGDGTCVLGDNETAAPNNCFAAHNMSGAVPGTDQSINEIQGTDYNETAVLVDPQTVKLVKNYYDGESIVPLAAPVGMDATVYSACSRLVIQHISGATDGAVWSSTEGGGVAGGDHGGYWINGLEPPVVDVAAWDSAEGAGGGYSAEINAGGSLIFGYNWNTKLLAAKGPYRVTFVLEGAACGVTPNTVFDSTTKAVNVGERIPAILLSGEGMEAMGADGGEGGLTYLDIQVGASGGGGGGGGSKGGSGKK